MFLARSYASWSPAWQGREGFDGAPRAGLNPRPMSTSSYFSTNLYHTRLIAAATPARRLNRELEQACLDLAQEDRAGQRWSRKNLYPGYTSYASLNDLAWRSPPIAELTEHLDRHIAAFARALQFDLGRRRLKLDSLWVNCLEPGGIHSGHIHPHSVISGTYYVTVPRGSGGLKLEDPRLPLMMAAPPKKQNARIANRTFIYVAPKAGEVLLWESWLRHEVVAGTNKEARISISFNYA
jgi:uncharacterized protein (TIGR02466 family)